MCHGWGFVCPVALCAPASSALPLWAFSQCALLQSSHDWRGTPALRLPAINPLYKPSLDFSARVSCLFGDSLCLALLFPSYSWLVFPCFFDCVFVFIQVVRCALVCLASVSPLVLVVIFDSGFFVLPRFLFSPSVSFLERQAQFLFPLFVVPCVLLPVSSQTTSVELYFQ